MDNTAKKFDSDKDPWDLMPWDAARAIVKILLLGKTKYGARNWENGMAYSRLYAATIRHLTSWFLREGVDQESGYSHLWHAGCCVLFLIAYEIRNIGVDDRPKAADEIHS